MDKPTLWCTTCIDGVIELTECCGHGLMDHYGNVECCGIPDVDYEECSMCEGKGKLTEEEFFKLKLCGDIRTYEKPHKCEEYPLGNPVILEPFGVEFTYKAVTDI